MGGGKKKPPKGERSWKGKDGRYLFLYLRNAEFLYHTEYPPLLPASRRCGNANIAPRFQFQTLSAASDKNNGAVQCESQVSER